MPKLVETFDPTKKPFEMTIFETPYRYSGFIIKCVECGATAGGSPVNVAEYDKAMSEVVHEFDCLTGRISLEEWRHILAYTTLPT